MDEKAPCNDADLVKSAQKGDRTAFDGLVERYHDTLFGFIHSKVYDISTVEDIVQEAFLIAYRSIGNCKKPASFRSWLFSIAKFTAIKVIEKRRSHSPLDSASENTVEHHEQATEE
jgi:RNA polymerase sigma-70 factor (ECF subfamily)